MASIFLSYSREDVARIRPLASALESSGYEVWWDQHIAGGEQFAHAIEQALDNADAVVVVWTDSSCRSAWVRDEAASARDTDRLIPVCLDGCVPPLGFRQFQAIDLRGWNGRASSKTLGPLKAAIAAKVNRGAAPVAARPVQPPAARLDWLRKPQWIAVSVAVLLLAAAALLIPRIGAVASSDSLTPKIALGDFAVISPDVPEGMSRAMHDEIMAAFGAENSVAVTSVADGSPRGDGVAFVFDGSIRKDGDALRFTVNLKDNSSDTVIWSRAFDRAAADPLATRQVAVAASQVVRCALWGGASYPKRMPDEALSRYLQFCNEYWGGSPDDRRLLDAARRVTVALPDFSFGWSALALAAVPLSHGGDAEAAALREEALEAARKATRLDSLNPEGYMAEAGLLPTARFADREALLKKAISVRPTECGCERTAYGDFLTSVGRMEEAVDQYRRAQAMMPLSPAISVRLAQALFIAGRHAEAEQAIADMLEMWPDAASLRLLKLKSAFWTRRYDEALTIVGDPALHLTNAQAEALTETLEALRSGSSTARAASVAKLQDMAADPRRNDRLAVAALAALGAEDAAVDAAHRLIRARGPMLADILFDPNLAAAASSPQYSALVSQLGLAGYWRSTNTMPDICRTRPRPAFCSTA